MRSSLAIGFLCGCVGCVNHVTAVRPLGPDDERGLAHIVEGRTVQVTLKGEKEQVQWKDVRFAVPKVRFRQGDPPDRPVRGLPEAETAVSSIKQIQVRDPSRGTSQRLVLGALTGATLPSPFS